LTVLLEVSRSLAGDKIEQARAALEQLLAGLRPSDRFRIIAFNSVVRSFRPGFAAADAAAVREAREYLEELQAGGSTNVEAALEEALRPEARAGRMSQIVFLTDGKPTVGETSPERIADTTQKLLDGERVFAFGVGHDVNTYLLDRLSVSGHGTVSYVRPGEDVEVAVASLSRKISHPALSELRIVDAPVQLEDSYPSSLPDLFYGEELVLFGRYRGEGDGELVLEGNRGSRSERLRYRVEFAGREAGNEFIPRLWAARKAGALTSEVRLHGADRELIEEIRDLGLRYGILTEYTSYLVEDPQLALRPLAVEEVVDRARAMSAPAEAQTGAEAFKRAERSNRLRQAASMDEAEKVGALGAVLDGREGSIGERQPDQAVRHVEDRLFVFRNGMWTDIRLDPDAPVIEVAPFSDAYFQLLRGVPVLKAFFALGERVIIAGEGLTLELAPEGPGSLEPEQRAAVIRAFKVGR
ncbi:MAG: VWA domain-containing protein, partial [Acidobacteriota bacterium]